MRIHLKNDQRVIILGTTGSGKTVLAKHFLARLNRVVVIDPKHEFRLDGFTIRKTLPLFGSRWRMIYRPRGNDDDARMVALFRDLFRLKNATIYVDELASLTERYPHATAELADIARTGREKRVTVWAATQRPRFIPRVFLSEAENSFVFSLRLPDDRAYVAKFTDALVENEIERFAFWYYHPMNDDIALMRYNLSKNYIEKIG